MINRQLPLLKTLQSIVISVQPAGIAADTALSKMPLMPDGSTRAAYDRI
jgi:hypothetical protein